MLPCAVLGAPTISVVIATHNRAQHLPDLVSALEQQQGVADPEVVFVDDCSTDASAEVLDRLAGSSSLALQVLRTERNSGPAVARNLGWRAGGVPLVAFTDDDCLPDPRWLARIVAGLHDADLVQGRTIAPPGASGWGPFARTVIIERPSWKFETCNIGYRRQLLEAADGFDERFAILGEDCDLAWRAIEGGAKVAWDPEAIVVHRVVSCGSRLGDWLASLRFTRRLVYAPLIVKAHPGLRRHLFMACFYKPHHALSLVAFTSAAAAAGRRRRRGRLLAVGTLPWLVYRVAIDPRPAPRRWLWAVLPLGLVADLAAIAATAEGSVRHRALLV